jgi:maleate isomerase
MAAAPRAVGRRARVGVIVPSTNTVVEHDLNQVRPHGVTFHAGRMYIGAPAMDDDAAFTALIGQIRAAIDVAVRDVVTCAPDHLLMGMSAETFWGGIEGNRRFEERIRSASGIASLTTGATACRDALARFGVSRLAVFSPYQPIADEQVHTYFSQAGFEVVRITGLRCPTATSIAAVDEQRLVDVVRDLDGPDVEAIVQVGTNLSFLQLADAAERWLGKPVLAINAATLWHALRSLGIADRFDGYGRVLREF